jgi:hypothetical protein
MSQLFILLGIKQIKVFILIYIENKLNFEFTMSKISLIFILSNK